MSENSKCSKWEKANKSSFNKRNIKDTSDYWKRDSGIIKNLIFWEIEIRVIPLLEHLFAYYNYLYAVWVT